MARISIKNVTKYYGKDLILNNISLDIKDKEFFCITGPSGGGKTTLLKIVAGLDTNHTGRVCMDDVDITYLSPVERNIAMVFQEYALYPNLMAKENILFPLRIKKYSNERVTKKLKSTVEQIDIGIEKYLNFYPKELSAGHKQRVATGRAIIRDNPNVFLLDEPLSNLDAKIRMNTRTYLKRLVTEIKSTTIYVTSDSSEAMALADRIAVLDKGGFIQIDRPFDIYFHPKNMLVADFFGILGMNFIRGKIKYNKFIFDKCRFNIPSCINKDTIKEIAKEELVLGIRPEDVGFSTVYAKNKIMAKVDLIQKFPPRVNIRCKVNGSIINVVNFIKNTGTIITGMNLYLDFDKSKTHLFYLDSGDLVS